MSKPLRDSVTRQPCDRTPSRAQIQRSAENIVVLTQQKSQWFSITWSRIHMAHIFTTALWNLSCFEIWHFKSYSFLMGKSNSYFNQEKGIKKKKICRMEILPLPILKMENLHQINKELTRQKRKMWQDNSFLMKILPEVWILDINPDFSLLWILLGRNG